jgi:ribosomal protein S18 acetylase RimI-like enzyme
MVDPIVRLADPEDADDVVQLQLLEQEARAALVGQRGGDRWLVEHAAVDGRWPQRCGEVDVWVAVIDAVVVGYLVAELGDDLILRIDQVWVTPDAREVGFGDGLLAAAIESARRRGGIAVQGESLPGDRQTKNLYERAGIVARLITTFRWFNGPSTAGSASR